MNSFNCHMLTAILWPVADRACKLDVICIKICKFLAEKKRPEVRQCIA